MTVAELKRLLNQFEDDEEVTFQGGLTIYRMKHRGRGPHVEFDQIQAMLSDEFKAKHPRIQVAFQEAEYLAEGEVFREIELEVL